MAAEVGRSCPFIVSIMLTPLNDEGMAKEKIDFTFPSQPIQPTKRVGTFADLRHQPMKDNPG